MCGGVHFDKILELEDEKVIFVRSNRAILLYQCSGIRGLLSAEEQADIRWGRPM